MKWPLPILGPVVVCLAVTPSPGGDGKDDAKNLEGAWTVVEAERNGQKAPEKDLKNYRIVFMGDRLVIKADKNSKEGTYALDPAKKPKAIDLTPSEGADKGKTLPGIYALEGGKLRLCFQEDPAKERPTKFATQAGSGQIMFTLQRAK